MTNFFLIHRDGKKKGKIRKAVGWRHVLTPGGNAVEASHLAGRRRKGTVTKEGLRVFWRLTCGVITVRPGKLASGDYICLMLLADTWKIEMRERIVVVMKISKDTGGIRRQFIPN